MVIHFLFIMHLSWGFIHHIMVIIMVIIGDYCDGDYIDVI